MSTFGVDPSGLCEDSSLLWGPETHFRALRKRGTYHDWNDRILYAWCQWGAVIGRWGDTRLLQRGDGVWIRLTGCSTRPQTHTAAGRASVISLQAKTISTYGKKIQTLREVTKQEEKWEPGHGLCCQSLESSNCNNALFPITHPSDLKAQTIQYLNIFTGYCQ